MKVRLALLLAVSLCVGAHAELIQGIGPLENLREVKAQFPNAKLEQFNAAWVTEDEKFYLVTGQGLPGKLYIDFIDVRPYAKKQLSALVASASKPSEAESSPDYPLIQAMVNRSDDETLTTNWARWVPDSPIPLARYKSKYGEPSSWDYDSSTMQPTCRWKPHELEATLSDDKLNVLFVTSTFTKKEWREAYDKKTGSHPARFDEAPARAVPASTPSKSRSPAAKKQ